ncbi:hypothetical protein BHM03_00041960 [Ensete ventricosum]|nr:hypothetical protein BHM03_00041960 [Ensete ventricosum]
MIEEEGSDDKQGQQEAEKAEGEGSGCDQRGLWLRLRLLRRKAAATSKGSRKQRRLKGGEGTEVAGECCVWSCEEAEEQQGRKMRYRRGDQGYGWQRRKEEGSGSRRRLATMVGDGEERKKRRRWWQLAWLHRGGAEGDGGGCCG